MARRRHPLRLLDRKGKRLRAGDRVRLTRRPIMRNDPPETRTAFRQAVGRVFVIADFDRDGYAELDLSQIERWDSIWVDPRLLSLVSRGRASSQLYTYVCFTCRKSFRRPVEPDARGLPDKVCPDCCMRAIGFLRIFKAPSRSNVAEWAQFEFLISQGFRPASIKHSRERVATGPGHHSASSGKRVTEGQQELFCSFCDKSQHDVKKLIAGPGVFICDECIELCYDLLQADDTPENAAAP